MLPKIVNKELEDLYCTRIIRSVKRRRLRSPRNMILIGGGLVLKPEGKSLL